jgi:serine/threonine protein kinase
MDEQEEALRARAEARLGSTLGGKYRLDRVVGIGGMATVYAATHRNQAELAVKVLHPELSLRDDLRKRFLREGYVGNSVKHPGAVLVVDDDIAEDGSAFLVMELLRGRSLEDLWERSGRRLGTRAVTAMMVQLLDVLSAAHEKAIVHRDLKPANLFVSVDGSLKVLDFGIARLRDAVGGEHATRTGTLMGTPAFMAPEQAQAVAEEIDGQTDLWAVGATMFTLLSGQLVHDGDNSSQLLIKAGTSRARLVTSVAPHVEPAIAHVIDRALAFEKHVRWPSADAMRDALLTASLSAHGAVPGRESLTSLLDPDSGTRRLDGAKTERAPGSFDNGATPPRLVVTGDSDIRVNDPTFATPGSAPGTPSAQGRAVLGRTPPPRGSVHPPLDTAVSHVSQPGLPALPGLSTANPVSAEASTVRKPRGSVPWGPVITGGALLIAAIAVFFAVARPTVGKDGSTQQGAATAPVVPVTSTSPAPTPSSVPTTDPLALPPVTAAIAATSAASAPATPSARATSPTKATKAAPAAAHKPAAAAAPDCSTPYTLNANGEKVWRVECLQP